MYKAKPLDEKKFKRRVLGFYRRAGRNLPWRTANVNPYHIVVSEIMLQQTQVTRVIPKYEEFIKAFPSLTALAKSSLSKVLKVWQGLGYNRRGRALRSFAEEVIANYHGVIPEDIESLKKLPGIGSYTAGAIMAFAFNKEALLIETNIRTALIHHFFPGYRKVADRELEQVLRRLKPRKNFREWYWALMDYGATLKQQGLKLNDRSKHYIKQPAFKGSRRELRGKILKSLLERPQSVASLALCTEQREEEVKTEVARLCKERLIVRRGGKFFVGN